MITENATVYEPVIGLEVHAQLLTRSKMFCSCRSDYQNSPPNTVVCPVCLGMPGMLPVVNRQAVEFVIMTGLALNCTISTVTKFDRKNYPYPDLMKGYQISQYDQPIANEGWMNIQVGDKKRRAGITRVHLEEDVAKLFHRTDRTGENFSLLDVNRSGVPLMEIVGEPDLHWPEEARQYLIKLQTILRYLNVSTANMEEGSFRCDANISLRLPDTTELGVKVEVKNMNSFRAVYRALEYEIERQHTLLCAGERIIQETRGWEEEQGITVSQRSKEQAHDYRYFPDPDLTPLTISEKWVEKARSYLPELPEPRQDRLKEEYGLSEYDASLLTASRATADYFENTVNLVKVSGQTLHQRAKKTGNWVVGELARLLNISGKEIGESYMTPAFLSEIIDLVESKVLSTTLAKAVFEESFASGKSPTSIVQERGMAQITDVSTIKVAVNSALTENNDAVTDYLNGKETALRFLTGQVMKITKGKANPELVQKTLQESLEGMREK